MRSKIARLLYRTAKRIDPNAPTVRRIDVDYPTLDIDALVTVVSGRLGKGIVNRGIDPGKGNPARY